MFLITGGILFCCLTFSDLNVIPRANDYSSSDTGLITDRFYHFSGAGSSEASENLTDWEISKIYTDNIISAESYPRFFDIYFAGFKKAKATDDGRVDLSRNDSTGQGRSRQIYARTFICTGTDKAVKLAFGYFGAIRIFLNQESVYSGNSSTGTVMHKDTLYPDLKRGINELFLVSAETSGSWGFAFKSVPGSGSISEAKKSPVKLWETKIDGLQPESVVYDPVNDMIYCSQYDSQYGRHGKATGFISRLNPDGEISDLRWIDSLYAPAGICLYNRKLYILERKTLTVASADNGEIINRYPFPEGMFFPNDIVSDNAGSLYVTNSAGNTGSADIFLFKDNHFEEWLGSDDLSGVNGILYTGNELVIGNSGRGLLQAVDIKTKNIRTIVSVGASVVDGIEMTGEGRYLVSTALTGNLYLVTEPGEIQRVINAGSGFNIANFAYLEDRKLLLIPTFINGTLQAYFYEPQI